MKVSVLLTTYNHEKWIAQAVESTLIQETNFDYEVVILEDCSTDSTREIVLDFQRRYPDKIRLILSAENKNDNTNFVAAWETSPSQYVAVLDGDDYWTSLHKLQKQADFLDAHPGCAICFHNVWIAYEDGRREPWDRVYDKPKEVSGLEDLWSGVFIPSPSPMFRKGLFERFPTWFDTELSADWATYILHAQHGDIRYIDEIMGVYRDHSGGLWSGSSEIEQLEWVVDSYRNINANLDFKYRNTIDKYLSKCYEKLAPRRAEALEELLSTPAGKGSEVWESLRKELPPYRDPSAPVKFVDVSSWDPNPEEGRWLAWRLQLLNRLLKGLRGELRGLRSELRRREQQFEQRTKELDKHTEQLRKLENALAEESQKVQRLRQQKRQLKRRVRNQERLLEDLRGSTGWKFFEKLSYVRGKLLSRSD